MDIFALHLLPPANEVWGKVIFSQASIIVFTGGGVRAGGGMCARGGVRGKEGHAW